MSKCLKLYISVPLFSSSTYDVQSVCVGFFHHMQQFYGLQRRYAVVRSLSRKRRRFRLWHTHTVTRRRGSFNLMTQRWRTFCVWPYILRIPSSSTLYISQLDSNAIHSVKHRPQESKQPTVCQLGSRKPTIYYLKYTTSYFVILVDVMDEMQ